MVFLMDDRNVLYFEIGIERRTIMLGKVRINAKFLIKIIAAFVSAAFILVLLSPCVGVIHTNNIQGKRFIDQLKSNSVNNNLSPNFGYVKYTLLLYNNTLISGNKGSFGEGSRQEFLDPLNNHIYIDNFRGRCYWIVNGSSNTVISDCYLPYFPNFFMVDPINSYIYSDCGYSSLAIINATTNHIISHILTQTNPFSGTFDPLNGNIYLSYSSSNVVTVMNASTNSITGNIDVGQYCCGSIMFDRFNGNLYLSNSIGEKVLVINPSANNSIRSIQVLASPGQAALDGLNGNIYVPDFFCDKVSVINGSTNTVIGNVDAGKRPIDACFDPLNGLIYVANAGSNYVTVINGSTNAVVGNIEVGSTDSSVVFDPSNGYLYVANCGSGTLSILSTDKNAITLFPVIFSETGLPHGTEWSVTLGNKTESSLSNTITFSLQNGSYSFLTNHVSGYVASNTSGSIRINGVTVKEIMNYNETFSTATLKFLANYYGSILAIAIILSIIIAAVVFKRRR